MNLGIMQGRLTNSEKKNCIQYFPAKNWKKEIFIMKNLKINILEWTINFENINVNHFYNQNKNKELKTFLKNHKIQIHSVTCDFFMQQPFFKSSKYRKTISNLKKVIKLSYDVGAKLIILPLVDKSSLENINQEKILIKKIKKISKYLRGDQKIIFEMDYPPKQIIRFINNFNHKFGINYDTGNSASMGYSFDDEKRYFKYVKNIHIKDRIFRGNTVRLGNGNYNFRDLFNYLKKIKYKGNLILQTARARNHIKEILINKKFLMKYL
jgi:L-ribulose-5-phosphate 3-epimerase